MRRLICLFVVCTQQKLDFLRTWLQLFIIIEKGLFPTGVPNYRYGRTPDKWEIYLIWHNECTCKCTSSLWVLSEDKKKQCEFWSAGFISWSVSTVFRWYGILKNLLSALIVWCGVVMFLFPHKIVVLVLQKKCFYPLLNRLFLDHGIIFFFFLTTLKKIQEKIKFRILLKIWKMEHLLQMLHFP